MFAKDDVRLPCPGGVVYHNALLAYYENNDSTPFQTLRLWPIAMPLVVVVAVVGGLGTGCAKRKAAIDMCYQVQTLSWYLVGVWCLMGGREIEHYIWNLCYH